jgi:signal transduction histidine kinase
MLNSLRFRLIVIFVGLAVGPLALVGTVIGQRSYDSLVQQSLALQHKVAMGVGAEIRAFIEQRENELVLLNKVQGLEVLQPQEQRAILGNLLLHQQVYQELALLDAEGQEQIRLSRSGVVVKADLRNRAENKEFLFPATRGQTYFSPVRSGETIREPLITVSVPLFDLRSGEIASVLVADLRFKMIWDLLSDIELPKESDVYVADQAGHVVAHRNPSVVLRGTVADLPKANGRARGLSRTDVIVARDVLQFGDQEITVVAEQSVSEALALALHTLRVAVVVTSAALVLAGGLVVLWARRVVQPIEALAASARAISSGDFSRQVAVSSRDEVGQLARAFNTMSRQLQELLAGLEQEIADRKQAEGMIRKLNEELEQRVAQRTAELEAVNKELEAFTYSVSHDLRAPLRGIDGFSQALLEDYADKLDPVGQDYLRRAQAAARRMGQLIGDLLNLSRVTRSEIHRETVDLSALARAIVEQLEQREPERRIEFVIAERVAVNGDAHLLQVMLQNLLDNAFKFTSKHPQARIEFGATQCEGEQAYFVRDDGAGFDMAYADKLFRAFERLHGVTEFKGNGIGLATVQRIIHRHGGRVWAESAAEGGATFYFTLTTRKGGTK